MKKTKRRIVCIGMPVYNGDQYLANALDMLLAQTYSDFHLVILDDGSSDSSYSILKKYSKQDKRISLYRNRNCSGLIAAWNKVAKLAGELFNPDYFAWYSDHDWVANNWLIELVEILDNYDDTVMAYSATTIVDNRGETEIGSCVTLDTSSLSDVDTIRALTLDIYGSGNLIYGLFRYSYIVEVGFFPDEILPDRLVVSRTCLSGGVKLAPEAVRYRRNLSPENYDQVLIDRQVKNLFGRNQVEKLQQSLYLRNATFFLRKLFDGNELFISQHLFMHAFFYFYRIHAKYKTEIEVEYERSKKDDWLLSCSDLVGAIICDEWPCLLADNTKRQAHEKIRAFKKLNQELREEMSLVKNREQKTKQLNQVFKALNKDLNIGIESTLSKVSAFKDLNHELSQGLEQVNQKVKEYRKKRKGMQVRLNELKVFNFQMKTDLAAAEKGKKEQSSNMKKLNLKVKEFKEKNRALKERLTESNNELAKHVEAKNLSKQRAQEFKKINCGLQSSLGKANLKISKQEVSLELLRSKLAKNCDLKMDLSSTIDELKSTLDSTIESVNSEKARVQKFKVLNQEIKDCLLESNAKLSSQIKKRNKVYASLQELKQKLEGLNEKYDQLKDENQACEKTIKIYAVEKEKLLNEISHPVRLLVNRFKKSSKKQP